MAKRLESNLNAHKDLIDTMREYYNVENVNPSGLIYANGTGTFAATIKDNFASMNAVEVKKKPERDVTDDNFDRDILWRRQACVEPVSVNDLLFIDPAEQLPIVLARLKILIVKLK